MSADWLVVMSEDNWDICERQGLISVSGDRNRLARIEVGDRIWVYVNRKHVDRQLPRIHEIRADARVIGPLITLRKSPWKARGRSTFTTARAIDVERRLQVPAIELLKSLSFAGKPPVWGLRLLHAPLRLTSNDVKKLERAAARS